MATSVEQARDEIVAARAEMAPRHEGFRDFLLLDLTAETRSEVQLSLDNYNRREDLLMHALDALNALIADGHPTLAVREIPQATFADLQENQRTITAALSQFAVNTVVNLGIKAGEPEPKT